MGNPYRWNFRLGLNGLVRLIPGTCCNRIVKLRTSISVLVAEESGGMDISQPLAWKVGTTVSKVGSGKAGVAPIYRVIMVLDV